MSIPQDGLEVPCLLIFEGKDEDAAKAEKFHSIALSLNVVPESAHKRSNAFINSELDNRKIKTRWLTCDPSTHILLGDGKHHCKWRQTL